MLLSRGKGGRLLPASRAFGSDEEIFAKAERVGAEAVRIMEGPRWRFYVRSDHGWEEDNSQDPARRKD